jgi:DNA mismatch repair ATPase MutL
LCQWRYGYRYPVCFISVEYSHHGQKKNISINIQEICSHPIDREIEKVYEQEGCQQKAESRQREEEAGQREEEAGQREEEGRQREEEDPQREQESYQREQESREKRPKRFESTVSLFLPTRRAGGRMAYSPVQADE